MKQHITIEQLDELSDKGKERLLKWFYDSIEHDDDQVLMYLPDQDDVVYGGNWDQEINVYDMNTLRVVLIQKLKNYEGRMYPLLSIGQMIEFCMQNGDVLEKIQDESSDLFNKHRIVLSFKPQAFMNYGHEVRWAHDIEFCDALWEACVEVLEAE